MTRVFHVMLSLLVFASPALLSAKGETTRIAIAGGDLATPVEITDPTIVRQFQVWAGAGTTTCIKRVCQEHATGFIVDWPAGIVAQRPGGLQRYVLSFYATDRRFPGEARPEELAYVVWYEFDPATKTGFVYLPGRDEEWYAMNTFNILRGQGREGNWFRATSAWDRSAETLILK